MYYVILLYVGLFNILGKEKNIKIILNFIVYFDSVLYYFKLYVDWYIIIFVIFKFRWRISRSIVFFDVLRIICIGSENVKRI